MRAYGQLIIMISVMGVADVSSANIDLMAAAKEFPREFIPTFQKKDIDYPVVPASIRSATRRTFRAWRSKPFLRSMRRARRSKIRTKPELQKDHSCGLDRKIKTK